MIKIETEKVKWTGELRPSGVAVDSKRAARKYYSALNLHITDQDGNTIGRISFWCGTVDIEIDARVKVNLRNSKIYWPEEQTGTNNHKQILNFIEEKKKKALARGLTEDQALAEALGGVGTWEFDAFNRGEVYSTSQKYEKAGR